MAGANFKFVFYAVCICLIYAGSFVGIFSGNLMTTYGWSRFC